MQPDLVAGLGLPTAIRLHVGAAQFFVPFQGIIGRPRESGNRLATCGGKQRRTFIAGQEIAAIDGYYAYYGTYEVNMATKTVVHQIAASLRPNEVGIRYERHFEISGERLTLTTPPSTRAGEQRFNRLVWERIK